MEVRGTGFDMVVMGWVFGIVVLRVVVFGGDLSGLARVASRNMRMGEMEVWARVVWTKVGFGEKESSGWIFYFGTRAS